MDKKSRAKEAESWLSLALAIPDIKSDSLLLMTHPLTNTAMQQIVGFLCIYLY
jgi:hypothetical protein